MSAANKEFIREYLGAVSGRERPREVLDRYASDETLKNHIEAFETAFPQYELEPDDIIAEDDKVVVRATFRGTHKGAPTSWKHCRHGSRRRSPRGHRPQSPASADPGIPRLSQASLPAFLTNLTGEFTPSHHAYPTRRRTPLIPARDPQGYSA
jgi:hypothetical protein